MQLALEVLTGVCATLPDVDVGGGDAGEVFFLSLYFFGGCMLICVSFRCG